MPKKEIRPAEANTSTLGLRKIVEEHNLTHKDIAKLACVSPGEAKAWLAEPGTPEFKNIHTRNLQSVGFGLVNFLKSRSQQIANEAQAAPRPAM